jgi:two-component system, OmpR family, sensor histidine kinase BaeS
MFRTLHNRLIFSHILPMLIIIPLMGILLVYGLENWVYLPSLTNELQSDARFLAQVIADDPSLWKDQARAQKRLEAGKPKENIHLTLISASGNLVASSDKSDASQLEQPVALAEVKTALQGQEVRLVHFSSRYNADVIDIFVPVTSSNGQILGIVRLMYRYTTVADEFFQLRFLITGLLVVGLLFGSVLGYFLAISIEAPIYHVTRAVDDLAHGSRTQLLQVNGPEEIQSLSLAVNLLVTRLRELEQARKHLLANLVHELGRPLGAIRSAIQALARGAEKDPAFFQEIIDGMDGESARLEHLLNDLADLYDQVLGALELDLQPLLIQDWLPSVLRTWQEAAREKNLRWEVDSLKSLPAVQADPIRLAQVVGNLVSNAIKFTPPEGQVRVSTCLGDGEVGILVEDSGVGISPEEQKKIFDPFYRGSHGRRFLEGMGLGLSISRDLVNAHGGRLEVSSIQGAGSQFTVWLPVAD